MDPWKFMVAMQCLVESVGSQPEAAAVRAIWCIWADVASGNEGLSSRFVDVLHVVRS